MNDVTFRSQVLQHGSLVQLCAMCEQCAAVSVRRRFQCSYSCERYVVGFILMPYISQQFPAQ
eukprot:5381500-Amphidinium_carterae.1